MLEVSLEGVYQYARENFIPILSNDSEEVLVQTIQTLKPCRVLEIGTAVGYSASLIALKSNAVVDTIEIDTARLEIAKELWKNLNIDHRINSFVGDVDEIIEDVIKEKSYDLIFIDGPKSRYLKHLLVTAPHLRKGGIVLADDVLFFGMVRSDEVAPHKHRSNVTNLRKFMAYLDSSQDFDVTIYEKGNGIAVLTKK